MDYSNSLSSTMIHNIAKTQGEIFEYAYSQKYDMPTFIKQYMTSEFCNNEMDSDCSYFHFKNAEMCLPYILNEKDCPKTEANEPLDYRFIGMVYRYLVFLTEKPSAKVLDMITPAALDDLSVSYETNEIEDAAKSIFKYLYDKQGTNVYANNR